MARVLVKFFLLFFATYAIGVAIIVISAELCRQKNQALKAEANNASAALRSAIREADILASQRDRNDGHSLPSNSHKLSEGRDISRGIGFYYRHFVFDYKNETSQIVITLFHHHNHTDTSGPVEE